MKKTFTYDKPEFLNDLVMIITGEDCRMSAGLMPNIPEFIQASEKRGFDISSEHPVIGKGLRADQDFFDKAHCIAMLRLCQKHGVLPFWSLVFDNSLRQYNEPEIKYVGYNFGMSVYDEPYNTCAHPVAFARDWKWCSIEFIDAEGENVERTKQAIAEWVKRGYIVTYLNARLNPETISTDHYFCHEVYDAELTASHGVVEMTGKFSDNFDIVKAAETAGRNMVEAKKLLENLADSIGRKLLEEQNE